MTGKTVKIVSGAVVGFALALGGGFVFAEDIAEAPAAASAAAEEGKWQKAGQEIKEAAGAVGEASKETADKTWQTTKEKSKEAWESTKKKTAEAMDKVGQESSEAWETTKEKSTEIADKAQAESKEAWQKTKEKIHEATAPEVDTVPPPEEAQQ